MFRAFASATLGLLLFLASPLSGQEQNATINLKLTVKAPPSTNPDKGNGLPVQTDNEQPAPCLSQEKKPVPVGDKAYKMVIKDNRDTGDQTITSKNLSLPQINPNFLH